MLMYNKIKGEKLLDYKLLWINTQYCTFLTNLFPVSKIFNSELLTRKDESPRRDLKINPSFASD